jgi:hypothetical protein
MLTINFIYKLYAEVPSLSALKAEHVSSIASLVQASFSARSVADLETWKTKAPSLRLSTDYIPVGCLSSESGEAFLSRALEGLRALERSDIFQRAEFVWLLPFRFAFGAPYFTRNFEIGIMMFLLLRTYCELPFHMYGWKREELFYTRNEYSKYWLQHGLWVNPDFQPPLSSSEDALIGSSL